MKLLLVDDHALFREGMALLLRLLDPSMEVLHAADVPEAAVIVRSGIDIDLVLLDLHMPGLVGLQALHQLRNEPQAPPIVVLSGSEDLQVVWEAIDAGAMGFIQKQADSLTMQSALGVVLKGGISIPAICLSAGGRRGAASRTPQSREEFMVKHRISERQMQVLAKMAHGKPNKLIARELGISEATVKTHLSALFDALGVRNRTEAVFVIAKSNIPLKEFT